MPGNVLLVYDQIVAQLYGIIAVTTAINMDGGEGGRRKLVYSCVGIEL